MKFNNFDLEKNVLIVAEIGNNHEGDFQIAKEMVQCAAEAGVDAVKFQTIVPELLVTVTQEERLKKLSAYSFSLGQFSELAQLSTDLNLVFFSTPFDIGSANDLDTIQSMFKIASGDNNFFPLIDAVVRFNKPIIISTGLADTGLLDQVYSRVLNAWEVEDGDECKLAFLHCVASYPTPLDQANLSAIPHLIERYKRAVIGYSDHTIGIEAAILSIAAGAKIVEKHFTLKKDRSGFRDHLLSADLREMKEMVLRIREVELMLGSGGNGIQRCEESPLLEIRRSIAASRAIERGRILQKCDITWVRPGTGIPIGEEQSVIGLKTTENLRLGELISRDKLMPV